MAKRPEAFFDTSALFAGVWSAEGGARQILKLAEVGLVNISVSPQVLAEIENNFRRKAPDLLGKLAVLLDRVGVRLVAPAPESRYQAAQALTAHPGDARVLADAWERGTNFFVTLDRQHFLENKVLRAALPFRLGTPGDFLLWYREIYVKTGRQP
jgi:predicted nucleic acid-binding protein